MSVLVNMARYILGFCLGGLFIMWSYSLNAYLTAEDLGLTSSPRVLEVLRLSDVMKGSSLTLVLGALISGAVIMWHFVVSRREN